MNSTFLPKESIGNTLPGVMLNAYPDSIGNCLSDTISLLKNPAFENVFSLFYILPTFFNSDLDRGFSIIDYDLNKSLVSEKDLADLQNLGIELKFDIVLNHLSVASPQFQDLLINGDSSVYKDFFIDWNEFWKGKGELNDEGVIVPDKIYLDKLFMRKSGLPILKVKFPDGTERPYWNTFYQKITEENGQKTYLGQMDVNAHSPLVWEFYEQVLKKTAAYGCKILRLDAFAYLHKEPGASNFFNKPGTWEYLGRINDIAQRNQLKLLPEIHAAYSEHLHDEVAAQNYQIYDFFMPGLILHTIESRQADKLVDWGNEIIAKGFDTVNMLGCHDGIPLLDLKGILADQEIENLMDLVLSRGGAVKNLYDAEGKKLSYYQVNATYYSALGEQDDKMLLARALQLFMPGTPQVWYLDLFAGKNDHAAVQKAGKDGHKEINRTNLDLADIENKLGQRVVELQLSMIRLRNTSKAFAGTVSFDIVEQKLTIRWENAGHWAMLTANLADYTYAISTNE